MQKERSYSPFERFMEERDIEIDKEKLGNAGRQRRLKNAINFSWGEFLAIRQIDVPAEIKKMTKGQMSDTAVINLWMSPSPLTENKSKLDSLNYFIEKSQAKLWKAGKKEPILKYFKNIVDDTSLWER